MNHVRDPPYFLDFESSVPIHSGDIILQIPPSVYIGQHPAQRVPSEWFDVIDKPQRRDEDKIYRSGCSGRPHLPACF